MSSNAEVLGHRFEVITSNITKYKIYIFSNQKIKEVGLTRTLLDKHIVENRRCISEFNFFVYKL